MRYTVGVRAIAYKNYNMSKRELLNEKNLDHTKGECFINAYSFLSYYLPLDKEYVKKKINTIVSHSPMVLVFKDVKECEEYCKYLRTYTKDNSYKYFFYPLKIDSKNFPYLLSKTNKTVKLRNILYKKSAEFKCETVIGIKPEFLKKIKPEDYNPYQE